MPNIAKRRDERLEVRLSPRAKSLLQHAAAVEGKSVSAFVLDKSLEAAAEMLADRREFRLNSNQFDAFAVALDAPSKARLRFGKLLTARSVVE
jgi:uncharacterized protein (DUF1778 family)